MQILSIDSDWLSSNETNTENRRTKTQTNMSVYLFISKMEFDAYLLHPL